MSPTSCLPPFWLLWIHPVFWPYSFCPVGILFSVQVWPRWRALGSLNLGIQGARSYRETLSRGGVPCTLLATAICRFCQCGPMHSGWPPLILRESLLVVLVGSVRAERLAGGSRSLGGCAWGWILSWTLSASFGSLPSMR